MLLEYVGELPEAPDLADVIRYHATRRHIRTPLEMANRMRQLGHNVRPATIADWVRRRRQPSQWEYFVGLGQVLGLDPFELADLAGYLPRSAVRSADARVQALLAQVPELSHLILSGDRRLFRLLANFVRLSDTDRELICRHAELAVRLSLQDGQAA